MVKESYRKLYRCPFCSTDYPDEDDAEECRDECARQEDITEEEEYKFICEICNKAHNTNDLAELCEDSHSDIKKHLLAEKKRREESIKRLKEAAEHPSQVRLNI